MPPHGQLPDAQALRVRHAVERFDGGAGGAFHAGLRCAGILDGTTHRSPFSPSEIERLAEGWGVSPHRAPRFSEDGARLFFGLKEWKYKPEDEEAEKAGETGAKPASGAVRAKTWVSPRRATRFAWQSRRGNGAHITATPR